MMDGRMGQPVLEVIAGEDFDLINHYRQQHGFTVVSVDAPRREALSPFMFATCVGAAKRMLGIRAPWVLTPYQLYRYLRSSHG